MLEFDDGAVLGIEVKATATPRTGDFAGLRLLAERLGERFLGGLVLSLAKEISPSGNGLRALPVTALWDHAAR